MDVDATGISAGSLVTVSCVIVWVTMLWIEMWEMTVSVIHITVVGLYDTETPGGMCPRTPSAGTAMRRTSMNNGELERWSSLEALRAYCVSIEVCG